MKSYSDFHHWLICFLLLVLGIGPVIHFFIPIKVFGISLFVTLLPFVILIYINLKNINKIDDIIFVFLIWIFFFLIALFRNKFYEESISKLLISNIYVLYIPLFISIFRKFDYSKERLKILLRIFLLVFSLHFINTLFYLLHFPYIENINSEVDGYVADSRFSGIMGGANVESNLIVTLFLGYIYSVKAITPLNISIIGLINLISILPTISRGPLIIFIVNFIQVVNKLIFKGEYALRIFLLIFVVSIFLFSVDYSFLDNYYFLLEGFSERGFIDDKESGRLARFFLFSDRLFENPNAVYIGIAGIRQTVSDVLSISDNSFLLVASNLGLIFTVLFFILVFKNFEFRLILKNRNLFYFVLSIIWIILTNNAFLYFHWCGFSICAYYMQVNNMKDSSNNLN